MIRSGYHINGVELDSLADINVFLDAAFPARCDMQLPHHLWGQALYDLYDEREAWCVEHFGPRAVTLVVDPPKRGIHIDETGRWTLLWGAAYFRRAEDCVFFKLRWV